MFLVLALLGCSSEPEYTQTLLLEEGRENDGFGGVLVVDGDRMLVSAPSRQSQSRGDSWAFVFERSDSGWVQVAALEGISADLGYGGGMDLSGDRAVIGGRIVERGEDGSWSVVATLARPERAFSTFGSAVALDGDRVLVGAPPMWVPEKDGNPGAVYVFERQADGEWAQVSRILASDPDDQDKFGTDIAVSGDRALIGAWGDDGQYGEDSGAAYVFERRDDGEWAEMAKLAPAGGDSRAGQAVALSGDRALIGAPWARYEGRAYLFERTADSR